jgi:hypothetical protein
MEQKRLENGKTLKSDKEPLRLKAAIFKLKVI